MGNKSFGINLISWYEANKRNLPWRNTTNPYLIWLSEIILQQTRVDQGRPYFEKFIEKYPTIELFAKAEEQDILRLWQGLGYYSRARNALSAARTIVNELEYFPDTYEKLLKIKGIGDYTASAIASFAFSESVAVVDGNVNRVLARIFGIDTPINSSIGKKEFKILAQALLQGHDPSLFNQAIMEFGALHCVPKNPDCGSCVFNMDCLAFSMKKTKLLPVKIKNNIPKTRYLNYFIIEDKNGCIQMKQRKVGDIWQGLYDFPLIEGEDFERLLQESAFFNLISHGAIEKLTTNRIKHVLTHQKLMVDFWHIKLDKEIKPEELNKNQEQLFYDLSQVAQLPKPILIHDFLLRFFSNIDFH